MRYVSALLDMSKFCEIEGKDGKKESCEHIKRRYFRSCHAACQIAAVDRRGQGGKWRTLSLSLSLSWRCVHEILAFQRSIFGRWRIWSGNSFSGWWDSRHEQYAANLLRSHDDQRREVRVCKRPRKSGRRRRTAAKWQIQETHLDLRALWCIDA